MIRQAEKASQHQANAEAKDGEALSELDQYIGRVEGENGGLQTPEDTIVEVTGVILDKTSETIKLNGTLQLTVTVEPNNATNKKVTWSSEDESVVTVDSNGLVTAVGAGTTIITVTTEKGGKIASCSVTVEATTPLTSTVTSTNHTGTAAQDTLGNLVYIPGGFKIASDSGETVKEGIVIEDESRNQFVWIPVSNIDGSQNNPIKIDETNSVVITLGRYTFASTKNSETGLYEDGTPTKVQYAAEYAATTLAKVTAAEEAGEGNVLSYGINGECYELTEFTESTQADDLTAMNATAKNIAEFISSVENNHGYYIARYEASCASGSEFGVGEDETYYKPASKKSTEYSNSDKSYKSGKLWNFITQGNASKACRQMYYGNDYVESDLVNSYAWDTAILYIQAMGNANYANATRITVGNTTLKNTGDTGDEVCKIFDMASNCREYTTEYSVNKTTWYAFPCAIRGGMFYNNAYSTSMRTSNEATLNSQYYTFRAILYCKN